MVKVEKYLFYALIFFLPWQARIILKSFSEPFSEWNSISFYLTDLIILAVIFLWGIRWYARKGDNSPFTPLGVRLSNGASPPLYKRGGVMQIDKTEIALLVFLAISALSLLKARNFWLGFFREVKLIEMGILFLYVKSKLFFLCHSRPNLVIPAKAGIQVNESGSRVKPGTTNFYGLNGIFKIFVVSGLFQALIALGQFIRQKNFGLFFLDESPISPALAGVAKIVVDGEKFIRPYGLTPHPNVLAAFLLIAVFCALYLFTEKNKNLQWLRATGYAAVLAVLVFAFFLTFSRTVIIIGLGVVFGWLIHLLFCHSGFRGNDIKKVFRQNWFVLNTIAIFTVCCLLVIIMLWPFFSARFDVETSLADQALNLRVFYNKIALQFIGQNPVLGVGIGNFVSAFQASQTLSEFWMYQPAHNIYLLIASEIGTIGLLAFLAFLFFVIFNPLLASPFKRGRDARPQILALHSRQGMLVFLFFSFLIIGFFDHFFWTLQQGQLMFWILLGIIAGTTGPRS